MGIFDKAKQFADDNPDKVNQGIDKGGDAIDERTGGKHAQHTDKVQEKAGDYLTGGSGGASAEGQPGEVGQAPA